MLGLKGLCGDSMFLIIHFATLVKKSQMTLFLILLWEHTCRLIVDVKIIILFVLQTIMLLTQLATSLLLITFRFQWIYSWISFRSLFSFTIRIVAISICICFLNFPLLSFILNWSQIVFSSFFCHFILRRRPKPWIRWLFVLGSRLNRDQWLWFLVLWMFWSRIRW